MIIHVNERVMLITEFNIRPSSTFFFFRVRSIFQDVSNTWNLVW